MQKKYKCNGNLSHENKEGRMAAQKISSSQYLGYKLLLMKPIRNPHLDQQVTTINVNTCTRGVACRI